MKTPLDWTLGWLAQGRLSVFLFHAVPLKSPDVLPDFDFQQFQSVVHFIQERFHVIPLGDAVQAMQRGKLPPRAACLTFDDGYASWLEGVGPYLAQQNLHATFYITTGQFHGLPMWHERVAQALLAMPGPVLHLNGFGLPPLNIGTVAERRQAFTILEHFLKYQSLETREQLMQTLERAALVSPQSIRSMTSEQLRSLSNMGFGIGAHTHSHPILTLCGAQEATREIADVRSTLQAVVGDKVESFAYPNGRPMADFHAAHVAMVKAAGYKHAVTTDWGAATSNTSVFEIPRFTPWGPTPSRMALQVARNLITRPKAVGSLQPRKPRVMVVENGAGFGGAVIALQALLGAVKPEDAHFHVVTNMPLMPFDQLPAVASSSVITDRQWDSKRLAQKISKSRLPLFKRFLLFGLGRLDDAFNRLPYLVRLYLETVRFRPDIIHGNNEPNSNREAILVAKLTRKPYVQHVRGPVAKTRIGPWLLGLPDMYVPVSRWLAADLLLEGVPANKIRQIYDGIELLKTHNAPEQALATVPDFRQLHGIPPGTPIVAMVGMLVPWKGQDLFLRAVADIKHNCPEVVFVVIGDTPEKGNADYGKRLQTQSTVLGLDSVVRFIGRQNNLAAMFHQFDVVVSASTEPEPLGLVMLEAMASGALFVAPAFGAATEVVTDGVNGFLFEPNNHSALAQKMQVALAAGTQRAQLAQQAKARVVAQFSPEHCSASTIMMYHPLMGNR